MHLLFPFFTSCLQTHLYSPISTHQVKDNNYEKVLPPDFNTVPVYPY